ncbi:MAG TPA: hypothetical protein VG870_07360 [Chitinophagaceae bacterium]|nr:hypothetical protein [Chitinophagaceae bacterium]
MKKAPDTMYVIPNRYRKMENLHIVFWLLKDISWCMIWRVLGIAMILPTLTIALVIAWRTRQIKSELAHNLAIAFWIMANSLWMISEFFKFDTMPVWRGYEGKHLALVPFMLGVAILTYYYAYQRHREVEEHHPITM